MMNPVADDHQLLEAIPDAILVTDATGTIVVVNRSAETMTGYRRSELVGQKIELLVPPRQRRIHVRHRREFYRRATARLMGEGVTDFGLQRKDGTVIPVEIALGPAGPNTVAVIRDETERRRMEAALAHRALHDPLTDLANRSLFFDRLRQSLLAARREGTSFALVMLDLDGFKAINDTFGHAVGDEVLKVVAGRLHLGMRATDTAARLGGDEFAWIFPRAASRRSVQAIVRKRLAAAQRPLTVDGARIDIGVSAGLAMYPEDGRNPDALLRHADVAMYSAKRKRRLLSIS